MRNLSKIGAAVSLAAVAVAAAAPAEARWRGGRGYYGGYHRGGGTGTALAAGIIGLGIGAAVASSNRGYRGGYYGGGGNYYGNGYYGGGGGYYVQPAPPPVAYYGGGYCTEDWRWDGYRGQYVRVRYCD